jgi:hypothetical protein
MTEQSVTMGVPAGRRVDGNAATLFRVAGYGALGAIATLVVSGVALAIFFSDTEALAVFGPINDITTAATILLLVPAVLAVRRLARGRVGSWFSVLSMVTLAGMALAAGGLVLLVVRVIDLEASFVTGGIGILPFVGWVVAVGYLALRGRLLKRSVGVWAAAFIGVAVLAIAAAPFLSMAVLSFTLAPLLFIALAGWLVALGRALLREAAA